MQASCVLPCAQCVRVSNANSRRSIFANFSAGKVPNWSSMPGLCAVLSRPSLQGMLPPAFVRWDFWNLLTPIGAAPAAPANRHATLWRLEFIVHRSVPFSCFSRYSGCCKLLTSAANCMLRSPLRWRCRHGGDDARHEVSIIIGESRLVLLQALVSQVRRHGGEHLGLDALPHLALLRLVDDGTVHAPRCLRRRVSHGRPGTARSPVAFRSQLLRSC